MRGFRANPESFKIDQTLIGAEEPKTVHDDLAAAMPKAKLSMLFKGQSASEL